jgi:hypothetical protein
MADLSPDRVKALMQTFNQALGVECVHCHVAERWTDESKAAFGTARNMYRMVQVLNQRLEGVGVVSCWTCHGGQQQPARQPGPPFDAEMARWPADLASAPDGLKVTMAVYNVALGVGCDHCHTGGDWKTAEKRAMKLVSTMTGLFDEFPKYMPAGTRTQCFMCHKGSTKPVAHAPGIMPGLL